MKKIFLCLILVAILFSCDKNRVFEKYVAINNHEWYTNDTVSFKVNIPDSNHLYNIYINVRHTSAYPKMNMWVMIETIFPSGNKVINKVELPILDKGGKPYGEGLGGIWEVRVPIQENAYFPETGNYHFKIQQIMRLDPLPAVMDVGLRLEKVQMLKMENG